ncbi:MAG: toxin-antitoxin system protein [Clostridia bacterium]|nr:toxin-antitoxin system protein [Clostridia bacterium]
MKPLKDSVSITLDSDIIKRIREIAEYVDLSLSQYINVVLKNHLKEYDKTHKKD